jgi:hypothetical protein
MKKATSFLTFLGLVVAAGIVWITYPTVLESELKTFRALSPANARQALHTLRARWLRPSCPKGSLPNPARSMWSHRGSRPSS